MNDDLGKGRGRVPSGWDDKEYVSVQSPCLKPIENDAFSREIRESNPPYIKEALVSKKPPKSKL